MSLNITFKSLKPRNEIKERAEFLYGKLERFLDPAAEGNLVVTLEHDEAVLELVVTTYGETHTAKEESDDMRTAMDKLFHTMEMRLRRHKERRVDRRHAAPSDIDGFIAAE